MVSANVALIVVGLVAISVMGLLAFVTHLIYKSRELDFWALVILSLTLGSILTTFSSLISNILGI